VKDSAIATAEENFTRISNFHPPPDGGGQVYGVSALGLRSGASASLKAIGVAEEISAGSGGLLHLASSISPGRQDLSNQAGRAWGRSRRVWPYMQSVRQLGLKTAALDLRGPAA
jgi:hypothetical protein